MNRRMQFSLGRLLAAITLVTLLASHIYTSWQLNQAREKMASMATELGYLTIIDPSRLNVIALKTYDEMTWRWRVHVPPGREYTVCSATSEIPRVGLPAPSDRLETMLDPGEYVLTIAVRADGLGKWKLTIAKPQTSIRTTIDEADTGWLINCPGYTTEQAGASGTEAAADGPFVLVRLNVSSNRPTPKGVTEGILIWAVEEKAGGIAATPSAPAGLVEAGDPAIDGAPSTGVPRPVDSTEPTGSPMPTD